jgi:hypothetical protein
MLKDNKAHLPKSSMRGNSILSASHIPRVEAGPVLNDFPLDSYAVSS